MKATLHPSQGYAAAFDLILLDGHEGSAYPTNVQLDDSADQIGVAEALGCDTSQPHEEGVHGVAYDFLKGMVGKTFPAPEGYFDGIPYGPFRHCPRCDGFHRLGYGGDCAAERYIWDGQAMIPTPPSGV